MHTVADSVVRGNAVHRTAYTDPALFALEQERIFRRAWLYVGHESEVPTAVTAPMITTAIKAAIRPYSMAVAPDSSCAKHRSIFIAVSSFAPTVVVACRCALDVRLDV